MIDRRAVTRFTQYSIIGGGTFLLDLLLLYIFIDVFSLNYLVATAVAFLIAVSCNYYISRKYVFVGSVRSHKAGYANFVSIALIGLGFVTLSMYILVGVYGLAPVIARVSVAALTGIWNYLMNLFVNFKVAGQ